MKIFRTYAKIAVVFFGIVLLFASIAPARAATGDNMVDENMTSTDMVDENMTSTDMVDENMTSTDMVDENMMEDQTAKPIMSPKIQMNEGVSAQDVQCKEVLQLLFKVSDGSPVCVKPDTANVLMQRSWATQS